ncbi:PspA/IM30 family protein [Alicyclobacillus ferrooxydans]|uniref:Phage-shock protein n=1 Tax=Alicyclobacillus ferrooxydans TaxID=471514 RepID=A0A0P9CNV2_9BACL|nr:PspA/IM30 family protein [Alicyclobacillus ferrooxydans]KPV44544.1 phage-shock protein [Alicyclobacillus ferrooxydans]
MGLFKRASDMVEAKVSKFLNRLEDPNEMLDLSYEKMLTNLQEVRRHLADVVTEQKALEAQMDKAEKEIANYEDSARAALKLEREDLAKEALLRKQRETEHLAQLREGHERIVAQVEKLKDTEHKYRDRIESFRTQKEVTKATYQAAQSQVKVSESMTGISKELGGVGATLQRAQEKTDQMVARANAIDALSEEGVLEDPMDKRDRTTRELDDLRKQAAVDSDLERLKKELGKDN